MSRQLQSINIHAKVFTMNVPKKSAGLESVAEATDAK